MPRKKPPARDVIRLDQFLPYKLAKLSDRLLVKNNGLDAGGHHLTTQEWKALASIADHLPLKLTTSDRRRHLTWSSVGAG